METLKTSNNKSNSEQKSNGGVIIIPILNLYYSTITIETSGNWYKSRHDDQWIRIEDPHINLHSYSQLIFNNRAQKHCGEKTAFSINVAGKTGYPHVQD
jgi:hypothetical protein